MGNLLSLSFSAFPWMREPLEQMDLKSHDWCDGDTPQFLFYLSVECPEGQMWAMGWGVQLGLRFLPCRAPEQLKEEGEGFWDTLESSRAHRSCSTFHAPGSGTQAAAQAGHAWDPQPSEVWSGWELLIKSTWNPPKNCWPGACGELPALRDAGRGVLLSSFPVPGL